MYGSDERKRTECKGSAKGAGGCADRAIGDDKCVRRMPEGAARKRWGGRY